MDNAVFNVPFVINRVKQRFLVDGMTGTDYAFVFYDKHKTFQRTYKYRLADLLLPQIKDLEVLEKEFEEKSCTDFINFVNKIVKERIESAEVENG